MTVQRIHSMTVQRIHSIADNDLSLSQPLRTYLRSLYAATKVFYQAYTRKKQLYRSYRLMDGLPENIRKDIGWPNINDRFAEIERRHKHVLRH